MERTTTIGRGISRAIRIRIVKIKRSLTDLILHEMNEIESDCHGLHSSFYQINRSPLSVSFTEAKSILQLVVPLTKVWKNYSQFNIIELRRLFCIVEMGRARLRLE